MARFILRRLLEIALLIFVVSLVCFTLMHAAPGGPAAVLSQNPMVRPEDLARIRENFGIDKPVIVQYWLWLKRVVLHGDFGNSFVTGEAVMDMIKERMPATLELMFSAFLLAFLLGISGGIIAAVKQYTKVDAFITFVSIIGISIPAFWLGLMSMMFFSVKWHILPSAGMYTVGGDGGLMDHLSHLVMPSIVLAFVFIASWSRYMRASLSEVLSMHYISVARAKGAPKMDVLFKHAVRNASIPVLTVIALNLPALFTGSIITETIFSWPGMGRLFYEGLLRQDYTRLMGVIFITSVLIALFNLFADVIYGILDPRVRYAK